MVEVTEEQAKKLERIEKEEARRKIYNQARSSAIQQIIKAHKDEYDGYYNGFVKANS